MDKLKMQTTDFIDQNIVKLTELFPNCVTETKDEKGNLKKFIDFDLLRQELSKNIVEGPQERYHLNWPGKREALLTANAPIAKTLRPCREESVNFDTTQNIFIEGDNLDALKLLQETYLGKIKMIYIDPPYNTGNDFIYEDDFAENSEEFLKRSNQKDEKGNRLVANTDSNGRFHSDWLSVIYPRLKLARNLLRDDGVIFISIDDNEFENLKKICDEIFGADQYVGTFTVNATPNARDYGHIGKMHEYIHFYTKDRQFAQTNQLVVPDKIFKYTDGKGGFNIHPLYNSNEAFTPANRPNLYFPIFLYPTKKIDECFYEIGFDETPGAIKIFPPKSEKNSVQFVWRWGKEKCSANFNKEIIGYKTDGGYRIVQKMRHTTKIVRSILDSKAFTSRRGTAEVEEIFEGKIVSFPKPVELIKTLVQVGMNENDIILDFFAGSATTAHAVMQLNAEDEGNRKFIMIQLDELCDEHSDALKAGYKTIADLGKERIRRVGKKIKEDNATTAPNLDIGFRVLKVDTSNMEDVYYNPDAYSQDSLFKIKENIKPDRTEEDLLFQVLLDWGVDLSLPVAKETVAGLPVYFVNDNALAACFVKDGAVTEDFCKELAKRQPLRVVFRDAGFKDDSVKINVEQIFKLMSSHTDVKTI